MGQGQFIASTNLFSTNLHETLPQIGHDVRGISFAQPPDQRQRGESDVEALIVQEHEQHVQILSLSQVRVKRFF
jgi:hypothetical protein